MFRECNTLALNSGLQSSTSLKKFSTYSSGLPVGSSINSQQQQQFIKELNELKKATCNFLFQSFQLYFIWTFCAKKFELICRQSTLDQSKSHPHHVMLGDNGSGEMVSPGQLCELYEFILDLLTNAEIYNEIQTEHLPVMLNSIVQTLDLYCPNMSNQNLTKSLLLCLKVLNKVSFFFISLFCSCYNRLNKT